MGAFDHFLGQIKHALGAAPLPDIEVRGFGSLPSVYAVTDLAAASIASAIAEVAAYAAEVSGQSLDSTVHIDRRLASYWFRGTIDPIGWQLPPIWDDIAGDYQGSDGWIRLHTNAPHHRAAALRVLDTSDNRTSVTQAVAQWSIEQLETEIVAAGGCAAAMRTEDAWLAHPNGAALTREPLIDLTDCGVGPVTRTNVNDDRPLAGIRVLDLTRVLAGPACTRFLAAWGAEVLRLDPLDWHEGVVIPEISLGKRCARIDLRSEQGRITFRRLLSGADILVHGYRSDALEHLGFGLTQRHQLRPGLVDVCLNAYGWTGSWETRRGFDSLVQMSCGIAHAGKTATAGDKPLPLPVPALDHATGYLMAASAIRGLRTRLRNGVGTRVRTSLARTARMLMQGPAGDLDDNVASLRDKDWQEHLEDTSWGAARRLQPPGGGSGLQMSWDIAAGELGRHKPDW